MATPNSGIPYVPENTQDPAAGLNISLNVIDAMMQVRVLSLGDNAPPVSPADGDRHIVGTAGSGAWTGHNDEMARYVDQGAFWQFYPPEHIAIAFNIDDGLGYGWDGAAWVPFTGGGGSGDVVGPASSVDNTLPRFDSTTGKLLQGSGVLVSDLDEISGYKGNINRQTGTSYTLVASDSGKIVELANAASIALTADPALPKGFCCTIVQGLAGVVTIASTGSGTVVNRQSQFKTAGTNAMCTVYVRSNSGSNAVFVFGGDTAA